VNLSRQLHPALYKKFDELERRALADAVAQGDEGQRRRQVWGRHTAIWFRLYGGPFFAKLLGLTAATGASVAWFGESHSLLAGAALATSVGGAVAWLARFVQTNRRTVSPEEFENLLPLLELSASEALYCDALKTLAGLRHIPEHETTTIAAQLSSLLDSAYHLDRHRALLATSLGEGREALEAEVRDLRQRLGAASDPVARESLRESLALCEGRLRNRVELEHQRSRVEAQAEAVTQTFKGLKESLVRLTLAPHVLTQPDLAGALQSISNLAAVTQALERPVDQAVSDESASVGEGVALR
jgi:hypothetical protein